MDSMDLRGLTPAPVTAFAPDGEVDYAANADLARWLVAKEGVKGLVLLGHAGEGTYLTADEQGALIETVVEAVDGAVPVIAGITGEGDKVAALEAKRAADAGAIIGVSFQPGSSSGLGNTGDRPHVFRVEQS